jgi:Flp pilus assembly protein TadG
MRILASKRDRKGESGSAMIEFALGATMMAYIFIGTFQWGYTFFVYNNVLSAVNNGAKFASLKTYDSTTATPSTCFTTSIKNMVAYGDPTGNTTNTVAPGLTPSKVTLSFTFDPVTGLVPQQVTVGISSYTINAVVGSTTLTSKPQMTFPYTGRYAPGEACVQ